MNLKFFISGFDSVRSNANVNATVEQKPFDAACCVQIKWQSVIPDTAAWHILKWRMEEMPFVYRG